MKFKEFIEDYFLIDDRNTGQLVPFIFNKVQNKYYDILLATYDYKTNFKGAREIILKARKEGFTSLILGLFAADIIYNPYGVRYLEISYKDDATKQHFRRMKNYIISYFKKKLKINDEPTIEKLIFESINEGKEFVLRHNKASFYCGTASTRTGERGGTVQGILFSEMAHYPDTGILSASEIFEGTRNMIAVGGGMIFVETTANGRNFFKGMWDKAKRGEFDFRPRFFGWREFYTPEEFEKIKKGFSDKSLIPQEYPEFDEEAFLSSGQLYFDKQALKFYLENVREPIDKRLFY